MSTRQTAEPLPNGTWQASVGTDALYFRDVEQDTKVPGGRLEFMMRRGVGKELDVGAKLYESGLDVGFKWRFAKGRLSAAVAPAVGFGFTTESAATTKSSYFYGHLPVILGTYVSKVTSLNLGPKAMYASFRPETGGEAYGVSVGGFVNLDWRFGSRWHLLPEINLYRSVSGEVPVRGWSFQGGPGLALDW